MASRLIIFIAIVSTFQQTKSIDVNPPDFCEGSLEDNLRSEQWESDRLKFEINLNRSEFIQATLNLHNMFRSWHDSPPLSLDDRLSQKAQEYADKEAKLKVQKHSCGPCNRYSENLAYKGSTAEVPKGVEAAVWAVESWYNEGSLYSYENPQSSDVHKYKHFAALIWRSSKIIGIGISYGTKTTKSGNLMNTLYVVCRYVPAGNQLRLSDMRDNIKPALK